jgi:hypothetical protein
MYDAGEYPLFFDGAGEEEERNDCVSYPFDRVFVTVFGLGQPDEFIPEKEGAEKAVKG